MDCSSTSHDQKLQLKPAQIIYPVSPLVDPNLSVDPASIMYHVDSYHGEDKQIGSFSSVILSTVTNNTRLIDTFIVKSRN